MRFKYLILVATVALSLGGVEPIRVSASSWTFVNPLMQAQDSDTEVVDLLFDRLVTLDDKGNFVPELLESWTILKGGREVVLKLRPGMTWHDGSPIEAEDLVATWRTLRLPQVKQIADSGAGIPSMDSLIAEGPLTVRIRLSRPRGTLLFDLYTFIPVPRRHYVMGADPAKAPVNFHPVGSGPYRLVGEATRSFLRVERWDGYRGIHPGTWPAFEFFDARQDKDPIGAMAEGRFHYSRVSLLRHLLVRKGVLGSGKLQALSAPQASFNAFFLNCDPKRSLLGDVRLRQALAELIPWDELARGQRFFPTRLATTFWPPENWAHDSTPRPLPSVERARALLDRAGWQPGPDGLRRDARGRLLELEAYEEESHDTRSMVGLLAIQARSLGMRINIHRTTSEQVWKQSASHEGDIWNYGWATDLDPDMDAPLFTLEGIKTHANVSSYANPEMDRLFQEARHTLDREQRKRIYQRIAEMIHRDCPVIPLTYNISRVVIHQRLLGVSFNELGRSFAFWPGRRAWRLQE
jgi:peptide/nickel transport system substrate-binding protein